MTNPNRRRAVSAGTAVVAAGATVALLQVLQEAIGAFDPQPRISALIVLAAFLAGLAAARVRTRASAVADHESRERHIRDLIGAWPAPLMEHADPVRLGVFPPRRDAGSQPPYVARDADGPLRAVLVPGALVLVVGEPRAGATRTLFEMARLELGDVPVIAPRSAEALDGLLDLDPPLALDTILVWLDGLDRFAPVLDASHLQALEDLGTHVTTVATIRSDIWHEWLEGAGVPAVAARVLAARAHIVELPAELSVRERAAAERLHPGLDLTRGIGAAIASRGRGDGRPLLPHHEGRGVGEPSPVSEGRRDPWLLAPLAGTALALVAFAVVWAGTGFTTPTIEDRLAGIEHDGERDGWNVQELPGAAENLHGSGGTSHLLLYTNKTDHRPPRSDELRIYDEEGTTLRRRLVFRPSGRRAVFQYRGSGDVDFDGATEIIGGYGYPDEARQALVPFAIDWDKGRSAYRLTALDFGPPELSRPDRMLAERQYRDVYGKTTTFAGGGRTLTGHRVQDFTLTSPPYRLVAGWFLHPWITSEPARLELHVAILSALDGAPHLVPCRFSGVRKPIVVTAGRDRALSNVFREAYDETSRSRFCGPARAS